jgi:hypothetical protein
MIAKFFKNRLKEASTYRGIIVLLGIFGVSIEPSKGDAIVAACIALYGVLAAFLPDTFGEKKEPMPEPVPTTPYPEHIGTDDERAVARARVPGQFL